MPTLITTPSSLSRYDIITCPRTFGEYALVICDTSKPFFKKTHLIQVIFGYGVSRLELLRNDAYVNGFRLPGMPGNFHRFTLPNWEDVFFVTSNPQTLTKDTFKGQQLIHQLHQDRREELDKQLRELFGL